MFDTIKIRIPHRVPPEKLNIHGLWNLSIKSNGTRTYQINCNNKYQEKDNINTVYYTETYNSNGTYDSGHIVLTLSIPKFMFGDNVHSLSGHDIKSFKTRLSNEIENILDLDPGTVLLGNAIVTQLHVCHNFSVGDKVTQLLEIASGISMPSYKRSLYSAVDGTLESVYWSQPKGRIIKLYDKQSECRARHLKKNIINQSYGILRFEIETTSYDRESFAYSKSLDDLLIPEFAHRILTETIAKLGLIQGQVTGLHDVEKLIDMDLELNTRAKRHLKTFANIAFHLGADKCKKLNAKSSYRKYNSQLKQITGYSATNLSACALQELQVDLQAQLLQSPTYQLQGKIKARPGKTPYLKLRRYHISRLVRNRRVPIGKNETNFVRGM